MYKMKYGILHENGQHRDSNLHRIGLKAIISWRVSGSSHASITLEFIISTILDFSSNAWIINCNKFPHGFQYYQLTEIT